MKNDDRVDRAVSDRVAARLATWGVTSLIPYLVYSLFHVIIF